MKKIIIITEALEEPQPNSNMRQITKEAERRGSCRSSMGLERWPQRQSAGIPGADSQHPLRAVLSRLQLQLQGS